MCCASCGCKKMEVMRLVSFGELNALRLNEQEMVTYHNIPEVYKAVHNGFQHKNCSLYFVHERFLINVPDGATPRGRWTSHHYETDDHNSLHQLIEKVTDDEWDAVKATICDKCYQYTKHKKRPPYSLSDGVDFGNMLYVYSRYDIYKIKPLTEVEKQVISKSRMYCEIIKLVSGNPDESTEQSRLTGHVIVLPSDGPSEAATVLPNCEIHEFVKVVFVGSADKWKRKKETLQSGAVFNTNYSVRADNTFAWLKFLKALSHSYHTVPIDETHMKDNYLETKVIDLFTSARLVDSEELIGVDTYTASDIANNVMTDNCSDRAVVDVTNTQEAITTKRTTRSGARKSASSQCDDADTTIVAAPTMESNANITELLPAVCVMPNPINPLSDAEKVQNALISSLCMTVRRANNEPINEFTENDELFYGTFPHIFPLGKGVNKKGGCFPLKLRQCMNSQYDNRASSDVKLQFAMFNQSQRHTAIRTVSARVSGNKKDLLAFNELANAVNFAEDIEAAVMNPDDPSSKTLMNKICPLIAVSSQNVAFGPGERSKTMSVLTSYVSFFGLPTYFITISPADMDSVLLIRLSTPTSNNNNVRGTNITLNKGALFISKYMCICSHFFDLYVHRSRACS